MKNYFKLSVTILFFLGWYYANAQKVIMDCDPGIDDAIALVLALEQDSFEILGVTTVFGNVNAQLATKNALRIISLSGKEVPVYEGAGQPLVILYTEAPSEYHGEDGLGNVFLPEPSQQKEDISAAEFMVRAVRSHPGEVTIIALGALTNISLAMKMDTTFSKNVGRIVVMGGAIHVSGNISPVAEFNIANDPHAADQVFSSSADITLIPLDVTSKVELTDSLMRYLKNKNSTFGHFLYEMTRYYLDNPASPLDVFHLHDPSAVMYVIDSSLFRTITAPVRVATEGIAQGQTIIAPESRQKESGSWSNQKPDTIGLNVDVQKFWELFLNILGTAKD